ncbi:hypothetical protein BD311DRAFT_671805 [Dichomitus squalens]|uniref:Uncharacterized protein n=1 Tax=Dichomitus squalens TaxID=114155 RepID=A0A4V2JZC5_9APHY|nr:hypothetical protein BD311DRAFT_671805 [Dichomitus squalens]
MGNTEGSPPRKEGIDVDDVVIDATAAATGDKARATVHTGERKPRTSTVPSGSAYSSHHAYGAPSTYDTAACVPTTDLEGNEDRDEARGAPEEMTDDGASALDNASTCAVRADSEEILPQTGLWDDDAMEADG